MEKTTIYLTCDQQAQLDALALRTGRPKAQLIREAVEAYVTSVEMPMPRIAGMIADREVDSENHEDWLAENWQPD